MEKTIFIDQDMIKIELGEINVFKEKLNRAYQLLSEFGINDPDAVKNPIDAANEKLKETVKISDSFEFEPIKLSELIGKSDQYNELLSLDKVIVNNPFLDNVRWNKKSFSINGSITKEITKRASVILTDKKQIELANRIEAWIKEAESIYESLGSKLIPMNFLKSLPVLKYKSGQIFLDHHSFLRYTGNK